MANLLTNADSLREYLSGAASDGATQNDTLLSLGGFRASREATGLGIRLLSVREFPGGVKVDHASGGEGEGQLIATGNTLAWMPPGAVSAGPAVTFSGTESKLLEAAAGSLKALRVTGTAPFASKRGRVSLSVVVYPLLGFRLIESAEALAGLSLYRGSIISNVSAGTVTDFKRWISPFAGPVVSGVGVLGASGAGTITTAGTFAGWPDAGWCQIRLTGGSLREIVYYTSRTTTVLTVSTRGMYGTTAAAGALTDKLYVVPGPVFGIDPAGATVAGAIQTIASETTAPVGVTWLFDIAEPSALVASITTGRQFGLWYWLQIPAGCVADPLARVQFLNKFTVPGPVIISGAGPLAAFRIKNDIAGYNVYVGVDALPDFTTAPAQFSATLPVSISTTPPGMGTKTYNVCVRAQNEYGLESANQKCESIIIDASGDQVLPDIAAPTGLVLVLTAGPTAAIRATYAGAFTDEYPADEWRIWISIAVPDVDVDAPSYTVPVSDNTLALFITSGLSPATTYNVAVVLRRTVGLKRSPSVTGTIVIPALPSAVSPVHSGLDLP